MTTLTFDAIGFCKALQASGFTREQAETLVEQQQKAITEVVNAKELATKGDVARLQTDLRELEIRTDAKLHELKVSLIKWIVGSMLSLAAFLAAVVFGIFAILPQLAVFMRG